MMRIVSFLLALSFTLALGAGSSSLAYTPPSVPPPTKNVYETIAANKKLGKFTAMIDEAGLKDMLTANSGEPVTVFAPSDDALADIPSDAMKRIKASKASLQSFVKYHMIAGSMVSSGAIKGRRASPASANGEALSFDGSDRTKPPKVGDGELVQADIAATNGIVHIVSMALVPPSLAAAPTPPARPATPAIAAVPTPAPAAVPAAMPQTGMSVPATGSAVAPATSSSAPAALHITTSGVAKAPKAATAIGRPALPLTTSTLALPMTTSTTAIPATTSTLILPPPEEQPSALPETTSSSGFELFGHKFGW